MAIAGWHFLPIVPGDFPPLQRSYWRIASPLLHGWGEGAGLRRVLTWSFGGMISEIMLVPLPRAASRDLISFLIFHICKYKRDGRTRSQTLEW